MASRNEQEEQVRATRIATENATVAAHTRRLQLLGGSVVIAVVVVAVAIAISLGGGGGGLATSKAARKKVYAQVSSLLAGIPEHGETLGSPHAEDTLTFFGDLQCPICAAFATGENPGGIVGGLPQFINSQVRTGHASR